MGVVRQDVVQMSFDIDMGELTQLSDELDNIKKTVTGGLGGDALDDLAKECKKTKEGFEGIKEEINGIKPDGVDGVADGLKDAEKEGKKAYEPLKKIAGETFGKTITGLKGLGKALGTVAIKAGKLLAKGIAAGAAGVGALVTKSVMNFADYEQLVGGVDTLFKDSSGTVQKYADEAYKRSGLSANEYMETVTSFSASLIQSLKGDTGKAAEYADMAIVDMSDNANKMGTDISSIQDAYQGFAKQNYTMLDNLKLGYGGTKEEMERLLKDAEKISGQKFDLSSYADVVQAIHVIQENMGIAGTTSKEASETISGSFASMKAAWSNTLTSLILGGDDFDRCVENLIDSAKTFGKNIMPAITKGLTGVGSLIEELAPLVEKELPGIIDTLLPPLIKAATSLVKGVIIALPDVIGTLVDELPTILKEVWSAFSEAFGDIPGMDKASAFFGKIIGWIKENSDTIKTLVPALIGLVGAFKLFNKIKGITGLLGGGSGAGGGGGFFSGLANMKPTVVLKGMLNLAIILGGLAILAAALMAVAPYMAQLSDLKSIGEVMLVMGAVGLLGTGMTKLAGMVGKIPVATVAKGLANIAIVMVGFGALAAVLMWAAPYVMQLSDMGTMLKFLVVIGAVGLVGSALSALAGIVGMIPTAVVLTGLANIALVLGGFTAVVEAFGLLSEIPGFNEFLTKGGQVLTQICGILGEMVGSVIGGIGEGLTASLPTIGENLSAFATSIQPMFETFSGVDSAGLKDFAVALAALIGVIAGEKLVSVITGGVNYAELGTNLSTMASSLSGFFSTIMTFPEGGFEKATALFDCLAGIKGLPKEGGVVGWFKGEVNFANMATGLNQLAGTVGFFTAIQSIPDEAFTKATSLFDCLAGIKSLPKGGGVVGWFKGEVNFSSIASGIQTLASAGMVTALTTLSTIPAAAFTSLTSMFEALAGIKAMPKEGGIAGWFGGDASTGLSNVASQLPGVATNIATFFTNLGGITDFTPIKSLFDTLSSIKIDSDAAEKGFLGLGKSDLETMGTGLANFATNASTFFSAINGLNLENMNGFFDSLSRAGDLPESLATLDTTVGTALGNLVTTSQTKLEELKTAFTDKMSAIVTEAENKKTAFYNSGVDMMRGLRDGILSMQGSLVATARSMAAAVQRAFDVELKIHSPSKTMIDSGEDVGMGGIIGLRNMIPDAKSAAQDFAISSTPFDTYSPESSTSTYNTSTVSETTTISPQFHLTISGTQDDRAMARKVQRWVGESLDEFFESLGRKNPVLWEV